MNGIQETNAYSPIGGLREEAVLPSRGSLGNGPVLTRWTILNSSYQIQSEPVFSLPP